MNKSTSSFFIGVAAFFAWGSLPIFWNIMFYMPAWNVISYRIIFSLIFISIITTVTGRWKNIAAILKDKRLLKILFSCGLLMGVNWSLFIVALSKDMVMEVSMGYYMTPLMNTLFGAIFYREKLSRMQTVSILFVIAGVIYLIAGYGTVPFFGASLAVTFALYGTVHKLVKTNVMDGMFYELLLLSIPALIYMIFTRDVYFIHGTISQKLVIILAGPFTAAPLMGFAYAVQNLRLMTVGMIQYISPTSTFILSIYYFHEQFTPQMAVVFTAIWIGLVIYTVDAYLSAKNKLSWKSPA